MIGNSIMVFDIETVPDVTAGEELYDLRNLPRAQVIKGMQTMRRQQTGHSDFMPLHLHKIIAISIALRREGIFQVWSLGELDATEGELIQRFFNGVQRYNPVLVSWNGIGFDLPVLHYRGLLRNVCAPGYWEIGDNERDYRWNNYLNRFHWRHIDLMDVLSGHQGRAAAPLDHIARLLHLPGKSDVTGEDVCNLYLAGKLKAIRDYCETDVLNTYLVYLQFERLRGQISDVDLAHEQDLLRKALERSKEAHLLDYLSRWKTSGAVGSSK